MSQNEKILEADKLGVSPYDLDGKIRSEVSKIIEALSQAMAQK
jgi:hypothetical protein